MTYLEALQQIRNSGPEYLDYGICSNLRHLLEGAPARPNYFYTDMAEWPEGTGSKNYPVPHPMEPYSYGFDPVDMAEAAYDLNRSRKSQWEGEYGRMRYRLLDYLIEREEVRHEQ